MQYPNNRSSPLAGDAWSESSVQPHERGQTLLREALTLSGVVRPLLVSHSDVDGLPFTHYHETLEPSHVRKFPMDRNCYRVAVRRLDRAQERHHQLGFVQTCGSNVQPRYSYPTRTKT